MDITNNATFNVLNMILNDCQSNTKIPLDYKVVATVTVIGIPINVPISNTISVDCPLDVSKIVRELVMTKDKYLYYLFIYNRDQA